MSTPLAGLVALDVAEVHASPANPRRDNYVDVDDLALSIRENGLIQPIVVQKVPGEDGYRIVAGHRRFAAVVRLGWTKVPAIVRRDMLPDEELLAMLVENGQRTDLDPIEEARAIRQLMAGGLTEADVARRIGRARSTVMSRLALLKLPVQEQEQIRAGHLPPTRALATATAARQEERLRQAGRPVGRPKGRATTPYFSEAHPLAKAVREQCDHRGRPKVGKVGCGPCWEQVIREDAASAYSTGYAADHVKVVSL